jgi:hypothetical protein
VKLLQPFHYDERRVSPEDVAQTDYNLFTVESVRAHRWTPGKHKTKSNLMFLIKWEGYDDQSNTWEPWENVAKVGILHEYLRSIPALKRFANNNLTDNPDEVT